MKPVIPPSIYIYIYKRPVCLFVCSDLEPNLLEGFQPNLAWTSPWTLWVTLKYFLWVGPPGGYNFGKTKISKLPHMAQDRGQNPFAAPFAAPFGNFWKMGTKVFKFKYILFLWYFFGISDTF